MAIVQLKDGSSVEIRRLQRRDINGLYQVMSRVFREGTSMLQTEMPFTVDQLDREFLTAQERNQITYVAVKPEGVVAWLRADRRPVPFMQHIATIWLGIDKEARGLGLGSHLLEEVIGWAKEQKIEKIELGVRSSNRPAIQLYKKAGFIQEGRKIKAIKTEQGYEDDIWMSRFVNEDAKLSTAAANKAKPKAKSKRAASAKKAD